MSKSNRGVVVAFLPGSSRVCAAAIEELLEAREDVRVRALVRNVSKAQRRHSVLQHDRVTLVSGHLEDAGSVEESLEGATSAFVAVPDTPDAIEMAETVSAVAKKLARTKNGNDDGIASSSTLRFLLALNCAGCGFPDARKRMPGLPHLVEGRKLWLGVNDDDDENHPLSTALLSPNSFFQNIITYPMHPWSPCHDGALQSTTPITAANAAVDLRDVGAAAAAILADDEPRAKHGGKDYILTGPESFDVESAAALLRIELDLEHLACRQLSVEEFKVYCEDMGLPDWVASIMNQVYGEGYIYGEPGDGDGDGAYTSVSQVSRDFTSLTGREPRTLADFLHENRGAILAGITKKKPVDCAALLTNRKTN